MISYETIPVCQGVSRLSTVASSTTILTHHVVDLLGDLRLGERGQEGESLEELHRRVDRSGDQLDRGIAEVAKQVGHKIPPTPKSQTGSKEAVSRQCAMH